MKKNPGTARLAAAAGILFLIACAAGAGRIRSQLTLENRQEQPQETTETSLLSSGEFAVADPGEIDQNGLQEDKNVYNEDDPDSMVYFYVTVRYGSEARKTNHTFDQVKNAVRFVDSAHVENDVYADALVQVGDETGPRPGMLGYGETQSNATIRVRGNSSTVMPQKSYKLSLNDSAGLWRGQSNIALNKHAFDALRLRNKLYFDLAKNLTEVPSIRTQFVRLFIKDETAGAAEFEDYGLYTQAEVPTKKYLANHGLDRSGFLYKAISFNFEPNDKIQNFDHPEFDREAMDTVISCRGREDNTRLMEMIEAVNDRSRDINEVLDTYFYRDNYIQWMAFNLLMGNRDTTMQNYYLYSPLNGRRWYFIPWDGDASLMRWEQEIEGGQPAAPWEWGIGNYWGILLHQRFLKHQDNRRELEETVDEMHQWLNKETVDQMARDLYETVKPYIYAMPDYLNLQHSQAEVEQILSGLGDEVEENYKRFKESLDSPMPFWMFEPILQEGQLILNWEPSYDFQGKGMTYQVTVSRNMDLSAPVIDQAGVEDTSYPVPLAMLGTGEYYWSVKAVREDGAAVQAQNEVVIDDVYYLGVDRFMVEGSGGSGS